MRKSTRPPHTATPYGSWSCFASMLLQPGANRPLQRDQLVIRHRPGGCRQPLTSTRPPCRPSQHDALPVRDPPAGAGSPTATRRSRSRPRAIATSGPSARAWTMTRATHGPPNGVFTFRGLAIGVQDVTDGTSNTIAFGEFRIGDFNNSKITIPSDVADASSSAPAGVTRNPRR